MDMWWKGVETELVSERLHSSGEQWGGGREWVEHRRGFEKDAVEIVVLKGYRIFIRSFSKPTRSYFDLQSCDKRRGPPNEQGHCPLDAGESTSIRVWREAH